MRGELSPGAGKLVGQKLVVLQTSFEHGYCQIRNEG
jgi:hypothetical protein